ncbi:hypothetical protein BC829DRAFT_388682 [Chytridium lagenaria]|nr:hypothetical protein BC829DRAFT_388682 [Chytridium lagenaria]
MKSQYAIDDHLAFDRNVLQVTWEKYRSFSQKMDITRKTYANLMMREILVVSGAMDQLVYPFYAEMQGGNDISMRTRSRIAELKKDIRQIMLVPAKHPDFDKAVTSVVERALDLSAEEVGHNLKALRAVLDVSLFRDLGSKYEKEKANVSKNDSMLVEFPMTFDECVVKDHMVIKKLFEDYKKAISADDQHKAGVEIIRHISVHSFAEEVTIYPLYEKKFENGVAIADGSRNEHGTVKHNLKILESMKSGDFAFSDLMKKLERVFFDSTLVTMLTHEEAVKLGDRFEKSKVTAPTHPHPSAPDKGGITQKLAGIATVPIDKARDAMSRD